MTEPVAEREDRVTLAKGWLETGDGSMPSPRVASSFIELLVLGLILAVGAYLRLVDLDFAQFKADDITLWNIARSVVAHPQILPHGMESTLGLHNGPFQAYLLLPGIAATVDPMGAYVTVALLNVVGILLFWCFVRNYWGSGVALLAAMLCATNPWAVIFSRRLWGNDLVAPFTVLLIWSLCDLSRLRRRRDNILPFVWLAILVQLYVVALVHLVTMALGLAFGLRRVRPAYSLIGLAAAIVLLAPYLLETILPAGANLMNLFGAAEHPPKVDLDSLSYMFHIVSSEGYQGFATQAGGIFDASSGVPYFVSRVTEVLMAIGLMVGLVESVRHIRRKEWHKALPYVLALVAVTLPPLLQVRHTAVVYPFYLTTGFPMHFLFVALGVFAVGKGLQVGVAHWRGAFSDAFNWVPRYGVGALVLLIVGTHLFLAQVFFVAIKGYWTRSNYGLPLRYSREITDAAQRLVRENGFKLAYIGGTEEHDSFVYRALKPDMPFVTPFSSADTLVIPDAGVGKVLYILSSSQDRVGQLFDQRLGYDRLARIDLPGDGVSYSFFGVDAAELSGLVADYPWKSVDVTFDGRARLDGYVVDSEVRPDAAAPLILRWTVVDGSTAPYYYAYGRLLDQAGEVKGGAELFHLALGQRGEQIIWWSELPVPAELSPGVYSYRVGLHSSGDSPGSYRNAIAVDGSGVTLSDGGLFGRSVVRSTSPAVPPRQLGVSFGDKVLLAGYGLENGGSRPDVVAGGPLDLDLYWQAEGKLDQDYTVFVHFLGRDGKILAQNDSQPASSSYPTSAWQPGDVIVDRHHLDIPPNLPPGQYNLRVGLYDLASGERLGGAEQVAIFPVTVK